MRGKMEFKRILQYLLLTLMPIYLVTGCGDLEPEMQDTMQDTRTVILKMDFDQRSSSRSSSRVSPSELTQYNTHLILAVSPTDDLRQPDNGSYTSNYRNNYSIHAQGLVNTADNTVSLTIPLDITQMKIFAFLFSDTYSLEFISGDQTDDLIVGNYGNSQIFSIDHGGIGTQPISVYLKVPEDLTATGGVSQVVLDWTAVSGATSYTVYWGNATGVSSSSTSIYVSTDSYSHTGLDDGSTYYYKVAAVDPAGTGILSSEVYATTATSSSFTCTTVSSCSSTASGSFYVDNGTLSGIYDLHHFYAHNFTGFDNSTGCVSNSNFTSGKGPTGTQSLIIQNVFTSSTSFATKSVFYSDTACSSEISSMVTGYNEVSVGDNVTGLRTSVGISTYPSHASKVTYKESCSEMKGTTDVGTAYLNTLLSTSWVTTGQTYTCQGSGRTTYALWAYDNSSVLWESLHTEKSSTAYPDNWSSSTDTTTKL